MIQSVTTFDAEWDDDDIAAALGWVADEADRCGGCGLHRDETMDVDRANAYDAEAVACHACAARDRSARAFREAKSDADGVAWRIIERG